MRDTDRDMLGRAINETQRQLALLVTTVNDLAASVKVEAARRQDLERRVDDLEHDEDGRRTRLVTSSDQRGIGLQLLVVSAAVSLCASLLLVGLSHIAWR